MPWASVTRPSISLGILGRLCEEAAIEHDCAYLNIDAAAEVGLAVAEGFASNRGLFGVSEHLFACDLFGPSALHSDDFLAAVAAANPDGGTVTDERWLHDARDRVVPALLDRMARRVLADRPTVVGFSATFNQVFAGLALAARLKGTDPSISTIFGGACYDGEMGREYHRALPDVIDHVFQGEAETSFRSFLARIDAGAPTDGIPGTTWWDGTQVRHADGEPLADMNTSPRPDYDPYFTQRAQAEREADLHFCLDRLPFESSRGCWWGQRNHCVFCGLNPDLLEFRSKDVDRLIDDVLTLSSRYRVTRLMATDWIISRQQRAEIFRRLRDEGLDLDVFFETRTDMSKADIMLMAEAGIREVQPGIESFSTPVLELMRKHRQGIRQVQFLRWCREAGVATSYNLLSGFPGEEPGWYDAMASWVPRLVHLAPPEGNVFRVELHRFSPLFNRRSEFGITSYDIRIDYQFNFPAGFADLRKVGYFFEFDSDRLGDVEAGTAALRRQVGRWIELQRAAEPPVLSYGMGADFLWVVDTRRGDRRELVLDGLARVVLLLCDEVKSLPALTRELLHAGTPGADVDTVRRVVDDLVAEELLLQEGELLLSLPVADRPRSREQLRRSALGDAAAAPAAGYRSLHLEPI